MSRFDRFSRAGLALLAAGCLTMAGCSATKQAASDAGDAAKTAASGVGDAAKTAATAAGQAALAPALKPVLDMLSKGQADLNSGNVGAAITAMGGFQSLWEKTGPVIKPLAGDKWTGIETAAQGITSTFAKGTPSAADASAAIGDLIGPLSALAGK
jgi:hypothetical protein